MPITLNVAAKAALDAGDATLESSLMLFDESGPRYDIPIGLNDASEAQVMDVTLETSVVDSPTWHLSFSVQVDDTLRTALLKYRQVQLTTAIRAADGSVAQTITEFTGKIEENDAFEQLLDEGNLDRTYRLDAFGPMKAAESAIVNRTYNPAIQSPAPSYPPTAPNWNLTTIARPVTLTMAAKATYTTGDEQVIPIAASYDNENNLAVYTWRPNATLTSSSSLGGFSPSAVVSGLQDQWISNTGDVVGAWVNIAYTGAQTVDSVYLKHGFYTTSRILSATLSFSDLSTVSVGALPADGSPLWVNFTPRSTTFVKLTVVTAEGGATNVSICEFTPYGSGAVVAGTVKYALLDKVTGFYGNSMRLHGPQFTSASFPAKAITGATNTNPITITCVGHGLTTNDTTVIAGVGGNTAANGTRVVTVTGADTFTIPVAGNGAYTSGGTSTASIMRNPAGASTWTVPLASVLGIQATDTLGFKTSTTQLAVSSVNTTAGTVTLTIPGGMTAATVSLVSGDSVYTYINTAASTQRIRWIDTVTTPSRPFYVDVLLVDRWVIKQGDTYVGSPFGGGSRTLSATQFPEDLANLPTSDPSYLSFYQRWDSRYWTLMLYRIMAGGAANVDVFGTSNLELRPDQGYVRWVGRPWNFPAALKVGIVAAPFDPTASSSKAETLVNTLLSSDVGISSTITLDPTLVTVGPVAYVDQKASDVLGQLKSSGSLPPGYYLHDERDGTVTGRFYVQKTTPDLVLRTAKATSQRDQLALYSGVRVRTQDPVSRNVAAQSLIWSPPSGVANMDYWFDGDTQRLSVITEDLNVYQAAFLISNPIDKVRINLQGRLYVGIEPNTAILNQLYSPSYLAPYHHPRLNYISWANQSDATDDLWQPYEPAFPYLLFIGVHAQDTSKTLDSAAASGKVGEVEIWTTPRVDRYAYFIDNSASFPLPADATAPKDATTGTPLYGSFADLGTSTFGSSANWWFSPSNKAYYRFAPTAFMKRVALNYAAGLHRLQLLTFPGISAVTAGSYATQTANEIVRRTAPVDVRCVWEPAALGDTVTMPDGTLRTVMAISQSGFGQDRSMVLSGFDLGF